MNVENINRVADAIEAACAPEATPEIGFNMAHIVSHERQDYTGHNCGTVCCIVGWDAFLRGKNPENATTDDLASSFGIPNPEGFDLACPEDFAERYYRPQHAIAVLRHLAETGRVDWTVGAEPSSDA